MTNRLSADKLSENNSQNHDVITPLAIKLRFMDCESKPNK
ncbi:hypothetical protein N646_2238 [Vibrio alginolyticus NBRC 15630 = ATCC 17749]|uniref:Uncharacterized protein n=1 Tax=Vibrio alginolyticus (strain ATCC 17749 / DSM 2171 / NBRC 15630 / NCIMB 1903 / NCTC 12160 / XII-53) TaxID=1219076 RepID=A0A2I3CDH3_VIBAX|nr:hypothetical protein N646_2238 [Vibrio alginolyticus NBRC 15630 = ATCC 17749]